MTYEYDNWIHVEYINPFTPLEGVRLHQQTQLAQLLEANIQMLDIEQTQPNAKSDSRSL